MATRHSKQPAQPVAVGYLRRSTSKQEKSLAEQQQEVERYAAAKGYRILRWYQDDGISGDATERRTGFQQLHRAACNGRDFDLILAWDSDRVGRFDSLELGYWIHPLRRAGVKLETVTEGPIQWDDFAGRLMGCIKQEGKHQYLRDLSRNVSRGLIANAAAGHSCGQSAPYGYDRILVDQAGQQQQRIKNGQQYSKPRGWRVTWIASDNPREVQTVRWLFQTYASTDTGYRALAAELNRQQIPGPTGGKWFDSTVRELLKNSAYIGTFTWNKRRMGKYHRVIDGQIVERDRSEVHLMPCGKPNARHNPRELWQQKEHAHPPLIDQDTWQAVQAKITRRKRSSGCGYQTHTSRDDRPAYLLTGLLVCQHCGRKMHGTVTERQKNGKTYRYQKYICSGYTRGDRSCGHHAISQDAILPAVLNKIRQDLLLGSLDGLKASLRKQLEQQGQADPQLVPQLRKRLAELERQISTGAKRVLTAPEELLDVLTTELQAIKWEREQLTQQLQQAQQAARPVDLDSQVEHLASKAWALIEELQRADPARVRELLRQAIERIELRFTATQQGKRQIYLPTGGKVVFRPLSGFANRGERSAAEPDNYLESQLAAAELNAA